MLAALTRKGQIPLPEEISDRLNLEAGAILDFQIQPDNTTTADDPGQNPRMAR